MLKKYFHTTSDHQGQVKSLRSSQMTQSRRSLVLACLMMSVILSIIILSIIIHVYYSPLTFTACLEFAVICGIVAD